MSSRLPDADEIGKAFGPDVLEPDGFPIGDDPGVHFGLELLAELVQAVDAAPDKAARAKAISDVLLDGDAMSEIAAAYIEAREQAEAYLVRLSGTPGLSSLRKALEARARDDAEPPPPPPPPPGDGPGGGGDDPIPSEANILDRGDEVEVAERALERYLGEHAVYDLHALHHYDPKLGAWVDYERAHVITMIRRYAGAWVHTGRINDDGSPRVRPLKMSYGFALGATKMIESIRRRRTFFDERLRGCGFTNGFLRDDGELVGKSHTHRLLTSEVLPFAYQPITCIEDLEERCPRWLGFLRALWRDDDDREQKIIALMQFVGRTMLGLATRHQMALLLYGPSAANGKSSLMAVLASLFPLASQCAVPPHLMGERFENVPLARARVNLVNDMPDYEIVDSGALKAIIGGDAIQFNPKHREPFFAAPRAGHVFAANNLPHVRDRSRGFYRRMLVLTFNRNFEQDSERDPKIVEFVLQEREQIAAACIFHALVLGEDEYLLPASSHEILGKWQASGNNVMQFTRQFEAVDDPSNGTAGTALYKAYRDFCVEAGTRPLGRNKFYGELRRLGWRQPGDTARREWLMAAKHGTEAFGSLNPFWGSRRR